MKPFTKIAAAIFGFAALIHVFRLFYPFRISIAGNEIPVVGSFGVIIIAVVLSVGLWKESKK